MSMDHVRQILVVGTVFTIATLGAHGQEVSDPYRHICVIERASLYRPDVGRFSVTDVTDPFMCSHVVYGPALVDTDSTEVVLPDEYDEENLSYLTSLKTSNPYLAVLLSIGGGPDGVDYQKFQALINDTDSQERFAQNCLEFVTDRSLDGIVLDWIPSIPEDFQAHLDNFTSLMSVISAKFKADNTHMGLEVSMTLSGDRDLIETFYPVQALAEYTDFLLVKTFDFYTADVPVIGHQSSIYSRKEEDGYFATLNMDYMVRLLQYLEVPSDKIVVGIPSHGRSLLFVNQTLQYFGAEHAGPGSAGPYSRQDGKLTFYEICQLLTTDWVEYFQEENQTPFAASHLEMVTYDNSHSIDKKVNYVKDNGLGGLFLTSVADDDFSGTFCNQGPFPLIHAIKTALSQSRDSCYPGEYGPVDTPGCVPCPRGTFQPLALQTRCDPCPSGYSTMEEGAKDQQQCLLDCGSGYEYSFMSRSCDICPLGYIRDASTHAYCQQCPVGMTTVAKGKSHCVDVPDVMEKQEEEKINVEMTLAFSVESCENEALLMSAIKQVVVDVVRQATVLWPALCHRNCSNLDIGRYGGCEAGRTGSDGQMVIKARLDNVTQSIDNGRYVRQTVKVLEEAFYQTHNYETLEPYGVTFLDLTDLKTRITCPSGSELTDNRCVPCQPGTFQNTSLMTSQTHCQPCPIGTYQNLQEMTSCIQCTGARSTVISGARSPTQCVSPCEARPGFCHNGGVCHWMESDTKSLHCQCFDGYTGDRCDVISDVYVDTGVIVGSSIGAVVAILLLIFIVISFVTCVRYARVKPRPTVSKPDMTSQVHTSVKAPCMVGRSRGSNSRLDYYTWLYVTSHAFPYPSSTPHLSLPSSSPVVSNSTKNIPPA